MAKAWVDDLWVKDAVATLPDGTSTRLQPTAAQLRHIGKLPEHFRTSRFGKGKRWRVGWYAPDAAGVVRQRTKAFDTKAAAEEFVAELEDDIRSSRYVDPQRAQTLFSEVAAAWLQTKTDVKESSLFSYRTELERYVLPKWGQRPIGSITRAQVEQWVQELLEGRAPHVFAVRRAARPLSVRTVRYLVSVVLAGVVNYAVSHKYLQVSPLTGVRLPRAQKSEIEELPVLTVEQLEQVAGHCAELAGAPQYRVLVQLLGYCGLRIGEATALQVRDLDLSARRATVRRTWTLNKEGRRRLGTPKTGRAREIPVPGFLAEELEVLAVGKALTDFVFQNRHGEAIDGRLFSIRIWQTARKSLGLDHITVHDLRHTAASLAIKAGADILIVQRMLGHANASQTLNTYSHLFPDKLDEVMERVEALRSENGGANK